jgi:hypothetical protein
VASPVAEAAHDRSPPHAAGSTRGVLRRRPGRPLRRSTHARARGTFEPDASYRTGGKYSAASTSAITLSNRARSTHRQARSAPRRTPVRSDGLRVWTFDAIGFPPGVRSVSCNQAGFCWAGELAQHARQQVGPAVSARRQRRCPASRPPRGRGRYTAGRAGSRASRSGARRACRRRPCRVRHGERQRLVARAAVHALTVASPGRKGFTSRRKFPRLPAPEAWHPGRLLPCTCSR